MIEGSKVKPETVSLRTLLWKNFHQKYYNLKPPTFGLNFLKEKKDYSKDFMLLCGFEKFDSFFVRIDILERLDKIIYENIKNNKNRNQFHINDKMISLLGTSAQELKSLLNNLGYIIKKDDDDAKKIIWFADIKKTRKLYTQKNSYRINSSKSKNGIFKDTDIKKLKDKLSNI